MPEELIKVKALTELDVPGEKTKQIGEELELPEATVKILEKGNDPAVERIKVESTGKEIATKIVGEQK